jgi:hypothetical protein
MTTPSFPQVARLLNQHFEHLAIDLLGQPSKRNRTELRFGKIRRYLSDDRWSQGRRVV